MYANLDNIKYSTRFTNPFKINAVSETSIISDKGMDFKLSGSKPNYTNRKNSSG